MKRFFVTGHKGYIGAHLVSLLKERQEQVTGCDIALFLDPMFSTQPQVDQEFICDVRSLREEMLRGHEVCVHLAALSNDPMGALSPGATMAINYEGTLHAARCAKAAGVRLFLFAGSCSIYGKGEESLVTEEAQLAPLTEYARSKVEAEKALFALQDENFSVVSLRNATAYGMSPMLRLDLVVNHFVASALGRGFIEIKSDGTPWRPLIHCKDIARAALAFADVDPRSVHGQAVNIGSDTENYQVRSVAESVQKHLPEVDIRYSGEVVEDPRSYRVSFVKLRTLLPQFTLSYSVDKGIAELIGALSIEKKRLENFESGPLIRLNELKARGVPERETEKSPFRYTEKTRN